MTLIQLLSKRSFQAKDISMKSRSKLANLTWAETKSWVLPVIFETWKMKQVVHASVMHVDGSPKPSR